MGLGIWTFFQKYRSFQHFRTCRKGLIIGENYSVGKGFFNDCRKLTIGKDCVIRRNVSFCHGIIVIGDSCVISDYCYFYATQNGGITVNNNVSIAPYCFVIDCNHGTAKNSLIQKQAIISRPVRIDEDVWIGAHVCILMGVHIGKGAVIGANSTVTHDIPPYAIAVGSPATVIKHRQ